MVSGRIRAQLAVAAQVAPVRRRVVHSHARLFLACRQVENRGACQGMLGSSGKYYIFNSNHGAHQCTQSIAHHLEDDFLSSKASETT